MHQKLRLVPMSLLLFILLIAFNVLAQSSSADEMQKDLRGAPESAIQNPGLMTVTEADRLYYSNEPMVVILLPGETHAYSLWQLDNHEVVNVSVGSVDLLVTWYPFSNSAAAYEATVDSKSHTFKSVSWLYQHTRVIEDLETSSLWSQVSGECLQGPIEGARLTRYPTSFMSFGDYQKNYPGGYVLAKTDLGIQKDSYKSSADGEAPNFAFADDESFKKLDAYDLVYGLILGDKQLVISAADLKKQGRILLDQNDPPIYISYYEKGGSVVAFSLSGIDTATIGKLSSMYDKITTSDGSLSWNSITGKLLRGDGRDLTRLPLIPSSWYAWYGFYPDTEFIK